MAVTNQRKNQHLLWRAGFGPSAGHAHKLRTASPDYYLKSLFESSGKDPASLEIIEDELQRLIATVAANRTRGEQMNAEQEKEAVAQRRQLQAMHRGAIKNLTLAWMNHMVHSEAQLREKMSLFWHAVSAFVKDLKANGRFEDVLLMSFSEFGRRVKQNAGGGTDHGTANNIFFCKRSFAEERPGERVAGSQRS